MSDASSSWAGVGFVEHEALSAAQADVDTLATGWQNGLTRSLNVETMPQDLVLGLGTNVQAVSINDSGPTDCGHTFRFLGSSSILTGAGGRTIAREGDEVIVDQGGTGVITSGSDIMVSA